MDNAYTRATLGTRQGTNTNKGNIGYKTRYENKQSKNTTQKTKTMCNTDPLPHGKPTKTKQTRGKAKRSRRVSSSCFLYGTCREVLYVITERKQIYLTGKRSIAI